MTFENTIWLYFAPVIAVFAAGLTFYGLRQREQLLSQFAAARLLKQLTEKASYTRVWIKGVLLALGLTAIAIALSRPQYGVEWSERKARGLDIVFVLDSSKSMLATDLRPTRLARAKLAILDLVERLDSDRIGIVAYAGQAFLQTPPTLDYSAFRESVDSIDPASMSRGGSDLGNALSEAIKAFPSENNVKAIVLLTDGEDLGGAAIPTVESANAEGIKIFAIGIGTPEGEYLKTRNAQGAEEFVRDSNGQPVRSQLDENTLQQLARMTNGSYSRLSDESLDRLFNNVIATLPRSERESEMKERRIERYQWALSLACILLVVEILIRRRKGSIAQLATVLLAFSCFTPHTSQAQNAEPEIEESLPLEAEAFESETESIDASAPIADARELYNKGHDQITHGEFDTALQSFSESVSQTGDLSLQRDALYNMAHSIFQNGESAFKAQDFQTAIELWKKSEDTFRSAHQIDPNDQQALDDAALVEARRKALEELLEQQDQPQDEQQDQENSEDGEEGDEQESEEQQDGEGEGESEESQDEQSGEEDSNGESGEQESEDGEADSSQEQSEGSQGEDQPEETSQPSESESNDNSEEESAPLPEPGEEEAPEDGEESSAPQPQDGEGDEQDGTQTGQAVQLQGMSLDEAQELLDSLNQREQLLPFVDQSEQQSDGRKRPMQDW